MDSSITKLCIAALLPVIATVILYYVDKKTPFGKLNYYVRQTVFGIIFGGLAIVGTEWGIPMNGAQVNCRDAAVLTGGLMFGAPAGIIAGIIGGAERWIAVAWGIGSFTRVACTVSTIIAGFYAAGLRKFMFENKKPGWIISFAIGVVMEIFHLTMVFITNMATPEEAMTVVKNCTVPMVAANGASVLLSAVVLTFITGEAFLSFKEKGTRISQTIQKWLMITVIFAFLATSLFVYSLQTKIAESQIDTLLDQAINDTVEDIRDASNKNILNVTQSIVKELEVSDLNTAAEKYEVTEISVINKNGFISDSSVPKYVGYDMRRGKQSEEFLCLLAENGPEVFVQDFGPISSDTTTSRKYAGVRTNEGFIQVGYDAERFQRDIDDEVNGLTKNRHVGESGYIIIVTQDFDVVSAPNDFSFDEKDSVGEPEPDTTFRIKLSGKMSYCRYCMTEGYYIVSVLPEKEALQTRNVVLYVNTFMEILVFAVLFGLIYLLIKRVVVNRIKSINTSLGKITNGDLNEVVNVRTNAEFASLSDDINSTVDTLKRYIDEASARIDKELEFAKEIQSSALPGTFPAFPKRKELDIYALMDPAKEVGGDFYDFYITDNDVLNFVIADVSGKGIPAAMFMMRAKTELKSLTEHDIPVGDVFTRGSEALCEGNDAMMFVTAWQGGIDLDNGHMNFANAGHNPPLVRHGNGKFEYLRTKAGFVLAGMEGVKYKTQSLDLEKGDIIFLYTDGVTEATNAAKELYGEERLINAINSREFTDMKELCEFIKKDVDTFVGDAPQFDDITMMAFAYIGKPPIPEIHFDEAGIDDIPAVTAFVESELEKINCPQRAVIQLNVAIDEIYSNIVKYAYPGEKGPVTVSLLIKDDPRCIYVKFRDSGIPYNPLTKDDPDITLSADERTIGGLGIYMVKKTMDDVKYKYENGENILTVKKIPG